jgi:hypothetical protein
MTTKPARSKAPRARVRALHHTRVAPCPRVFDQRCEYGRAGAPLARLGHRRHPADAPGTRAAFWRHEAHGNDGVVLVGGDRERSGRLVRGELVGRFMRPQDRPSQRPRCGDGDRADDQGCARSGR